MGDFEPYIALGLALAAGLLIGLEREQSAPDTSADTPRVFMGGVRTVPLIALLGAVSSLISRELGAWTIAIAFAPVLGLVTLAYARDVVVNARMGMTSELVFCLAFFLGVLAGTDVFASLEQRIFVVSALAVVVTMLLSSKPILHGIIRRTSQADVFATVKFLIVAVVVLPLLPNRTYGPLEVINPFKVGMMVVLIAGISFVGYMAMRTLGTRGLVVTAVLGGLVSSTAVMMSFAGRAKTDAGLSRALSAGVVLASSIMFGRVLVEVLVVNSALAMTLAIPTVAMFSMGMGAGYVLYRRAQRGHATDGVDISNPFELSSAVKFGLLFAVVLFVSRAASEYLGTGGTYAAGILSGLTDVDAITLSMAELAKEKIAPRVAVTTILLATASNTLVKGGMAIVVGGWAFAKRVVMAFAAVLAVGAVALLVVWQMG